MRSGLIEINGRQLEYTAKKRKGSRYLKLHVEEDGSLAVSLPYGVPFRDTEKFILEKSRWVIKTLAKFEQRTVITVAMDRDDLRRKTHEVVRRRIEHFNVLYGLAPRAVKVRKYKSRWGCCSAKRELTFNENLAVLPQHLVDYVVVHELCHCKEFNHSKAFWDLVAEAIPDYRERRKELHFTRIRHAV